MIESIKANVSIESVVSEVVDLKHKKGLCPFHNEKTPSFTIYKDRFHCFGCGEKGDVIDFVVKYYRLTVGEAIQQLASGAGITKRDLTAEMRKSVRAMFREWTATRLVEVRAVIAVLQEVLEDDIDVETRVLIQDKLHYYNYMASTLLTGDDEAKHALYAEEMNV